MNLQPEEFDTKWLSIRVQLEHNLNTIFKNTVTFSKVPKLFLYVVLISFLTSFLLYECLYSNIVNVIMLHSAENTTHMSHNTVLPAIVNHVVPYNVRTHKITGPSVFQCEKYRFQLMAMTGFSTESGG